MSLPKKTIRGLVNIRTHSATRGQVLEPYRAYFRIGSLEMEKARRGKEKESAMNRVQAIDTRFREIEAEKSVLLEAIGAKATGDAPGNPVHGLNRKPARNNGEFRISY
ncbi:MAG: hypothetical protein V1793_22730 [Pseudomonadota bacterium]